MPAALSSAWARGLTRRQLIVADSAVAAAYLLFRLLFAFGTGRQPLDWMTIALSAAIAAPIAARRIWPMPAFCVVLAASVLAIIHGVEAESFAAAAFCLYAVALVAQRRSPVRPWVIAVTGGVLLVFVPLVGEAEPDRLNSPSGQLAVGVVLLAAAWAAGQATRERRQYILSSARQQADRAVNEERLRIAREMHDVVAHGMSIIAVEAGVANHVISTRPEQAQEALIVIEAASREALAEMRRMLGVLRSPDDDEGGRLEPAPGVAQLPGLVGQSGLAGLQVDLDIGRLPALPDGMEQTIFRIVQESLTNVVKHADASRCRVAIACEQEDISVEVTDSGSSARMWVDDAAGHGLIGMRERVAAYGGTVQAQPQASGGFRVYARIPIRGTA